MIPPLFKRQEQALAIAKKRNVCLFHDCGTGKTRTALEIIRYWKYEGVGPAVVVCPKSIIGPAWLEDAKKFTPDLRVVSLRDKRTKEAFKMGNINADVYVCNFELFKALYTAITANRIRVLIVDESSKLKSTTSQITHAILSFAGINCFRKSKFKTFYRIPHRYALSGTPAPNHEGEYWSQIKFITGPSEQGFSPNYYAFRSKYFSRCEVGARQSFYKLKNSSKDTIINAIAPFCHVAGKEDLPPQNHIIRPVTLSAAEAKFYAKMENDAAVEIEQANDDRDPREDITQYAISSNILVKIMKLREITSGFCYYDYEDGEIRDKVITKTKVLGHSKLDHLMELLEETKGDQVIIWCNYNYEIDEIVSAIMKREGGTCSVIRGGQGDAHRDAVVKGFQNYNFQFLVANYSGQGAAHGLTFTNCHYCVYFSLNYSFEQSKQSADRIHRYGQKNPCTYYYLMAKGTIDEDVYSIVRGKKTKHEFAMEWIENHRKGRK